MSIFFFNESAIPEIYPLSLLYFFFFFNDTATTEIYTLSLHDALPICHQPAGGARRGGGMITAGHVLVVGDEKGQRDILTAILEGEGYTVETASNVSQALSAYRNHRAAVVLTDLSLPERDGLALLGERVQV